MDLFSAPKNVYKSGQTYNFMGYAGDKSVGEYINLYFELENGKESMEARIVKANFSAFGGVVLFAVAERFCREVVNKNFTDALLFISGDELKADIVEEKLYSVNLLTQAFYVAFEAAVNMGLKTEETKP